MADATARAHATTRTRTLLTATTLAIASTLLLSACAAAQPDITPLPTPTATEEAAAATPTPEPTSGAYYASEPTSEAQAIEDATRAYEFYLATAAEVYANPADPTPIDEIAKQDAAQAVHSAAAVIVESGGSVVFDDTFLPSPGGHYALETPYANGEISAFGSAHIFGCLDMSNRSGTNADGSPVTPQETTRVGVHVTALFDVEDDRWFIYYEKADEQVGLDAC